MVTESNNIAFETRQCGCSVCRQTIGEGDWRTTNTVGKCGLCSRVLHIGSVWINFTPEIIQEFFKVTEICQFCRNHINHCVQSDFQLCYDTATDETLKLAFTWYFANELVSEIWRHRNKKWKTKTKK